MAFDLTARLSLTDVNFSRNMRAASRSMSSLHSGTTGLIKSLGLVVSASAAIGVVGSSVKKAMDFESQMSSIKALTGATSSEMVKMKNLALDMGAKTKYSALEAGQGIEELLKAGLSPATVQAGALESALNLATAGGLDLKEAAEIMSTALNAFKADAMTAAQAANILAGTANASATDVHDLRYSLSMVSAVASGVGLSFKDTNAALGVLANNGLKGSDAGTSLKTMLLNLSPITKKQTKLFKELGIVTKDGSNKFYDAKGNIKSMAEIAGVLHNQLKDLTNEDRQSYMKDAFGTDAIRAANILYKEGTKGIRDFKTEMSKVTALDVAKQKMNNAAGAVEVLKGALETFQIQVMTPLLPVIKEAGTKFAEWMSNIKPAQVQEWGDKIKDAGQAVLKFAGFIHDHWGPIKETVIALGAAFLAYKTILIGLLIMQTVTKFAMGLRAAYLILTGAQYALNMAMDLNPIGAVIIAIAALIGIGVLLYRNFDKVKAVWVSVWSQIKSSAQTSINFIIGGINKLINLINKIPGVKIPLIPKVSFANEKSAGGTDRQGTVNGAYMATHSHASGLSNVPYDGYIAKLHHGERVLTSAQNDAYTNGKGGNSYAFHVTLNGTGSTEKDADKLFEYFVRKVEAAAQAGA